MNVYELFSSPIAVIAIALIFSTSCSSMNKMFNLKDDNVIEEVAEDILKKETGADLDFTPDSKEKKDQ